MYALNAKVLSFLFSVINTGKDSNKKSLDSISVTKDFCVATNGSQLFFLPNKVLPDDSPFCCIQIFPSGRILPKKAALLRIISQDEWFLETVKGAIEDSDALSLYLRVEHTIQGGTVPGNKFCAPQK